MLSFGSANDSSSPSASNPSNASLPERDSSQAQGLPSTSKPERIRSSSSCSYLPILGGLSGPASPAEVTKEVAFGSVTDHTGRFSPRILDGGDGYFSIRTIGSGGKVLPFGTGSEREIGLPSGPRRIGSSASLVTAGTSGTILTKDCGRGEMVTGSDSEGVATTVHQHHPYFYHHRKSSGNYESPEEVLSRVKAKAGSSTHQGHQSALSPLQRSSSSLALSYTATPSTSQNLSNTTPISPQPPAGASVATSLLSKTTATPSGSRPTLRTSPKSSLRLRLPPPPKVHVEGLGIGVHDSPLPYNHPHHNRHLPSTPEARNLGERRRDSAPGLLVAGIHPRAGGWLLTPPEEVGGMVWHCPMPDRDEEMIDREYYLDPEVTDVNLSETPNELHEANKRERHGALVQASGQDTSSRPAVASYGEALATKRGLQLQTNPNTSPEISGAVEAWNDDDEWGVGEEWLKDAANVLLSSLSPVQITQEAVRMLSYTLPCPLPTVPDPANAYVTVGASSATTGQGRLPVSAAAAPAVAKAAGHQLSPAIEARCNAKVKASNMASGGAASRDGVTTTIHIVTSVIQRRYSRDNTRRVYINVSHAIPPHIPLNRLPSIPPSAGDTSRGGSASSGVFDTSFGASLAGNEEYFSPTVFNSIVVAPGGGPGTPNPHHYHQNPLNPAPNPILPPNSLHYSILERFIPPENVAEDANMFSPTCSILLDRLVELSNQGGSLLFIYPTKAGARQFCRNVLGPVIDPLLRKLMVLYGLREDLLWRIRNMGAVEGMADWDQLKTRVDNFCKTLSTGNGSSSALGGKMPVRMVFASTAKVRLNDESWREWWSQQEQMRIREVVKRHFSSMPPLPTPSAEEPGKNKPAGDATGGASAATKKLPLKKPMKPVIPVPGLGLISPTPPPVTPSGAAVKPLDTTATRPKPPTSAKIAPDLNLTPLPPIPHSSQMMVAPLSPEASAHYLGIRSPSLSSHGFHSSTSYYNSQTYSIMGPYEGPSSSNAAASNNNNPNSTIPITSATSPPASSSGFTMGYGAPGDLAREVLDGVRAPAVRPSSQGMGEAVMASALAGSGGNTAIGQGMGGVVGDGAWSSRSKGVNAGSSSKMEEQVAVVTPGGGWGWGIYADRRVEVGVFVLRKGR